MARTKKPVTVKTAPAPAAVSNRDRLGQLAAVAEKFKGWRPAAEVLTRVQAQPTIFPQLNRKLRIGGWPLQRFALVHGPSSMGKTTLVHGLGLSFLNGGHFYGYIDAEFTTPETWLAKLMATQSTHPGFVAKRPKSYEDTVEAVREFAESISAARESGKLDKETTALLVVDSIRKLVPEKLMEKIAKGDGGVDGASGRAAMMRAALNAQWLDELIPMLYHANMTLIFIAREAENPNASPWEEQFKVGGGKALVYDSSLVCRVTRAAWVKEGTGDAAKVVGERHRVEIRKTKVAGKEGKTAEAFFHTSNGVITPTGFDRARDVFDMATDLGVIEKSGAWYSFNGERFQGESGTVRALNANPDMLASVEANCEPGEGEDAEAG